MNLKKLVLIFLDLSLLGVIFLFGSNVITLNSSSDNLISVAEPPKPPLSQISPISFLTTLPTLLPNIEPKKSPKHPISVPKPVATLFDLINHERSTRGLSPLSYDPTLSDLASSYSETMVTKNFFSHTDPSGKNPSDRLNQKGISFQTAGENIAYAPDVSEAHENLMLSEEHKANILNSSFTKVGLGIYTASPTKVFVTELFTN